MSRLKGPVLSGRPPCFPKPRFAELEGISLRDARGYVDGAGLHGDVQMLRDMLQSRFGNLVAGWRGVLDRDGSGRVSRKEFLSACRILQYPGDAEAIFDALSDEGELSLYALDKESAELLSEFAMFIREEFGTVEDAFRSGLAWGTRRASSIEFQTFMHACLEMRFRSQNFKRLFECLDFDRNGYLTLGELRFLETWRADIFEPPPSLDKMLDDALQRARPLDEVCSLVEANADPNRARNPGHVFTDCDNNALTQAVERGAASHVQRLLACRANPNIANVYGRTAMHGAAARQSGRVEPTLLIQHLYAARADPNARTSDGTTPLLIACGKAQAATVAILVCIGADVHAQDAQKRSPLWFSIFRKSMPCCVALLDFLADPCRRGKGDCTALAYAVQTRQDNLVEALQTHVETNYEVLLKAAARDLGEAFDEMPYLELLEHVPESHLAELLRTLALYSRRYRQ